MSENKFSHVLAASKSESILAVIAGLPVDANGFFLNEEQLTSIDAALLSAETAQASVTTLTEQLATATTATATAEAALATANEEITSLKAQVVTLGKKDAVVPGAANAGADPKTEANGWDKYKTSVDEEKAKQKAYLNI